MLLLFFFFYLGIGLLAIPTLISDCILLNFTPKRKFYSQIKEYDYKEDRKKKNMELYPMNGMYPTNPNMPYPTNGVIYPGSGVYPVNGIYPANGGIYPANGSAYPLPQTKDEYPIDQIRF